MSSPTSAPYGTWTSPISAERVAAGVTPLASPCLDGDTAYWLEGVPAEGGRVVVVRSRPGAAREVLTPPGFNVRSRVHEYGGGAYVVAGDELIFSNFTDNLVYLQRGTDAPQALTQDSQQRHADFALDLPRRRLIAVREDHTHSDHEPSNSLVALPLEVGQAQQLLTSGHDFYAAPRLSPDGRRLAWLSWDHPNMPWDASMLWIAELRDDGTLAEPRQAAGGDGESLVQPLWSPEGVLFVVSDRSGWWNLHRVGDAGLEPICPMEAEFGRPQWVFGQSMYGFTGPQEITAARIEQGVSSLVRIDLASGHAQPLPAPFTNIAELCTGPGVVLLQAGSPTTPEQIVRIDLAGAPTHVLARSASELPDARYLSVPQGIAFSSAHGRTAHAFYYPPHNGDFAAPAGELPPLIVTSHGGPTSMATSTLRLATQFWTSRGFAVLDVNYGGSSGYGRAYMSLLNGQWGIVDVEDCVEAARHMVRQGLVDEQRMAIRGGSASGFTTLCALAFHRVFKAGASHYGVSDLKALDEDTHKFESRYTATLVAAPPERDRLYAERSPAQHADRLSCPVIFFQGMDDKVVPPAQSEMMVAALRSRGIPVAYVAFEGEGHGFRRLASIRRALEAELYFFAKVFGFAPADAIEPVEIQ